MDGPATGHRLAMELAAALFAGGSLLTLIATVAPGSEQTDVRGSWIVVLLTALVAAVFWLGRNSLPFWTLVVGISIGTVLISVGVYINGERDGGPAAFNEVYYVWPVIFAAYYFPVRALIAEIAFVGACYAGALLLVDPGPIGVTRWLIVVTMLIGVGGLIGQLQARVGGLMARLSESARSDPLTGLVNRRGFGERLEGELARATRADRSVSLVLADLDHFKVVNDQLGHPAGDAVLLRVAEILQSVARHSDTVARLGGEEFVLIVPDAEVEEACELAERIRLAIEEAFATAPVPLTVSVGVVAFPQDGVVADDLLAAADRALYGAKRGGRNRCEVASRVAANEMSDLAVRLQARARF